jgi:hypothetical protein
MALGLDFRWFTFGFVPVGGRESVGLGPFLEAQARFAASATVVPPVILSFLLRNE